MIVEDQEEHLFVSFKVKDQVYALNAGNVDAIFERRKNLISVPKTNDCLLGLISLRGDILPVLDLRRLLKMESLEQEQADFVRMLQERRQDHIRWVEQLRNSVETGAPFTLAVDPHECAFGKWYDHYKAPNHAVMIAMAGIEAPHQVIHHSAEDCFACRDDKEKQRRIIETVTVPAMNGVLKGIDRMIAEFTSTKRNMCIVISERDARFGIAVDEVLSVEPLENTQPLDAIGEDELIFSCAVSQTQGRVLLLDSGQIPRAFHQASVPYGASGALRR